MIWGFPEIGVPPVIIHFRSGFTLIYIINHPFWGTLTYGNPHMFSYILIWLVVWLPFFMFPYIGLLIIPIDELIFFRGVALAHQPVYMCIFIFIYLYLYISLYIQLCLSISI